MNLISFTLGIFTYFLYLQPLVICRRNVLNEYIRHYEPLNYDSLEFGSRHRRAVDTKDSLHLTFQAHGKHFPLRLRSDDSLFTKDHVLEFEHSVRPYDLSNFYAGHVENDPGSSVHGSVINGTFRGEIHLTSGTIYFIEHAHNFLNHPRFHSVIYNLQDVDLDPFKDVREAEGGYPRGTCGVTPLQTHSVHQHLYRTEQTKNTNENVYSKYSQYVNLKRTRRAAAVRCEIPGAKTTCTLFMQSDPVLFNYYKNEKNYDYERTTDEIMALFRSHVKALDVIYKNTKFETFDKNICYRGIQFQIRRTKIMTDVSEGCTANQKKGFCNEHLDVSNVLNINSLKNHDDFCLAYVFTRRDFAKGTLGLAWVASPSNAKGGICEAFSEFSAGGTTGRKSLNTGVVTLVNYQQPVATIVSQLTFAHEVGHNFGSPHDDGMQCAPFGTSHRDAGKGNYIMFASATRGDKTNNNLFSECSKDNITKVLESVFESSRNCFVASGEAFCGNGILEDGEDCDCGFDEEECKARNDTCCHPRRSGGGDNALKCKLKSSARCSPSQGACCAPNCQFLSGKECRAKTDCADAASCTGGQSECPEPKKMNDSILCDGNKKTCLKGECVGSVCANIGWTECFPTADNKDPNFREKMCYVSCKDSQNGKCVSSAEDKNTIATKYKRFSQLLYKIDKDGGSVSLPPGSPCDQLKGYCDVFSKCRGVDADGPLARLKNFLFSKATLDTIRQWIQKHWWAVLLMSIGVVLLMGLFIYFCSYNTPGSEGRDQQPKFGLNTLRRLRNRDRAANARSAPAPSSSNQPRSAPQQQPFQDFESPPPYNYAIHSGGPPPGSRSNKVQSRNIEMRHMR